jgi:transposase
MSMQPRSWWQVPEQTVLVARAAFPGGSLAMWVRDELGGVFGDEQFAAAFGVRGAPAQSPGVLALVTALQYVENLTDRQAAQMVARAIDWKYALGLELTDPGFDHSVLSKFRARLVGHGLEERVFDALLTALVGKGLIGAGGKQRTDSTHVVSAVRDLNRLELAGESVRACLEALAVAVPGWLASVVDVSEWAHRYGPRVDSWRLPAAQAKRDRLATVYGHDAVTLLRAVFSPAAPVWLANLPAVQTLRTVLVQNYRIYTDGRGREVVKRREADVDGLPPARLRLTTPATVPDVNATIPIHHRLHHRRLLPTEHYLDSGYPSAHTITTARTTYGITLVTPAPLDHSAQARDGTGFDKTAFTIDFDTRQVTCPQGHTSASWSPANQRGTDVTVVKFAARSCDPCPTRVQCTTAKRGGRQLTLHPRELHHALAEARTQQTAKGWQDKYALRAGVEGTIHQAVTVTGIRRARYRGLTKTHLQHVFSAIAINLIRHTPGGPATPSTEATPANSPASTSPWPPEQNSATGSIS